MAKSKDRDIAEELGAHMKSVSVAEFFKKNKHLLGFDSPIKSMLMVVKEAVDNSLDATEEYSHAYHKKHKKYVFPQIIVEIKKAEHGLVIIPADSDIPLADLSKTGKTWDVLLFHRKLRAGKVDGNKKTYTVEKRKVDLVDTGAKKPKVYIDGQLAKIEERTLRYNVVVTDNGPGIIENNISKVFGKLLYGSKFHRLKQNRGQQGIGISSAVLYAQQTTGMASIVVSKTEKGKPIQMAISIADNNEPIVHERSIAEKFPFDHGTRFEVTIEADYVASGEKSVYEFLRRTSIVNPHASILFVGPDKKKVKFPKTDNVLPKESKEIKPHPHGIEFGLLQTMLKTTTSNSLKGFLTKDLSRISGDMAGSILNKANLEKAKIKDLKRMDIERLLRALHKAPLKRPSTDCLSPIGEKSLRKSILKDTNAEFITTISRKPTVYKGRPFLVEAAIAYGGDLRSEGMATRMRYANKIPLVYDAAGCGITKAIQNMKWKQYKVKNLATNGTPMGPYVILVHLASVWVPYTSEGKSAISTSYSEIIKEIRLALQDCARKLKLYLNAKFREKIKQQRVSRFILYSPLVAESVAELSDKNKDKVEKKITKIIEDKYGKAAEEEEKEGEEE